MSERMSVFQAQTEIMRWLRSKGHRVIENEKEMRGCTMKLDFAIEAVVNEAGGVASLDKILIGLYKKTREVHKRGTITSRLYRMRQKNTIFAVPNKSGFYSTKSLSEQDVKRLFGQDELDMAPDDDDNASPSVSSAPPPIRPFT